MDNHDELILLKETLLNENEKNNKYSFKESGLINCEMQLTDLKKIKNGYSLDDSVIDVVQGGYGVSDGKDYLFTYGIEPCCGVVLSSGDRTILFHLDGSSSVTDVINKTDLLGFNLESKVFIFPGVTCGISGSFDYEQLAKLYNSLGYDVIVKRINGTFGYVKVSSSEVAVGSLLFKDQETVFELDNKNIKR